MYAFIVPTAIHTCLALLLPCTKWTQVGLWDCILVQSPVAANTQKDTNYKSSICSISKCIIRDPEVAYYGNYEFDYSLCVCWLPAVIMAYITSDMKITQFRKKYWTTMHPILQHCQAILFPLYGRLILHLHRIIDLCILIFYGAGKCYQYNDHAAGW